MAYDWEVELPALSAVSDQEAANAINAMTKEGDVTSVSGQDIFEAATATDFATLDADEKTMFYAIIGMGTILVNGTNTRAALLAMFGPGTDTRANLALLQKQTVAKYDDPCNGELVRQVRAAA